MLISGVCGLLRDAIAQQAGTAVLHQPPAPMVSRSGLTRASLRFERAMADRKPDAATIERGFEKLGGDFEPENPTAVATNRSHAKKAAVGTPLLDGKTRPVRHNAPKKLVVSAKQHASTFPPTLLNRGPNERKLL